MALSVDKALRKAGQHARNGEMEAAERLYRGVIDRFPGNRRAAEGLRSLRAPPVGGEGSGAAHTADPVAELVALYNRGRLEEALAAGEALAGRPGAPGVVQRVLGAANAGLGRLDRATACYDAALQIDPGDADAHYNLGNALRKLGRQDEAVAHYRAALRIRPDNADACNNLGSALGDLGRAEEAIDSYLRALGVRPHYAAAHYNLGNLLGRLGRCEEAAASYAEALRIAPDDADALINLGGVLHDLGRLDEAVECYRGALGLRPDDADAHNNLGAALNALGRHEDALASCRRAVALAPEREDYWRTLAGPLAAASFTAYSPDRADLLAGLLEHRTAVRPDRIVRAAVGLLRLHPKIAGYLDACRAGRAADRAGEICRELSGFPLFLRTIETCPVPDLAVEELLRQLREKLLTDPAAASDGPAILHFQVALALHCFTNEFVFGETEGEARAVEALQSEIEQSLAAGAAPEPNRIACLAAYRPLHLYRWARELPVPAGLETLFARQVAEIMEEADIRALIPCLKGIADEVSSAVQAQYEANPYPRWINTQLQRRASPLPAAAERLGLKLIGDARALPEAPEILVAGCGTGQHSLATACRFANSRVLAVDLSLSSLSHAIRKTREFGIGNIDYMQADILDLGLLDRQFDIVESVGVLHHMADPMAGWRVLAGCLKPGGLMRIGLYSELARRDIVKARGRIAELGLSAARDDMLRFRREIAASEDGPLSAVSGSGDFYSTSALRDLLFHVQEHRFTLPGIKAALDMLGLCFAGFDLADEGVLRAFREDHPAPEAVHDLESWHVFETAHPDSFAGMYQFWAQKPL